MQDILKLPRLVVHELILIIFFFFGYSQENDTEKIFYGLDDIRDASDIIIVYILPFLLSIDKSNDMLMQFTSNVCLNERRLRVK